mgnify:FL=1
MKLRLEDKGSWWREGDADHCIHITIPYCGGAVAGALEREGDQSTSTIMQTAESEIQRRLRVVRSQVLR